MFRKLALALDRDRLRQWLGKKRYWPPIGWVRWGDLRRLKPIGPAFGYERGGKRIGRYYIEKFLSQHAKDIHGVVLEIADSSYTQRYGEDRVTRREVLHAVEGNPEATIVGDLSTGIGIPNEAFDCLIITQTYFLIYRIQEAIAHSYAALKVDGVLLATFPGIAHQISRYDMDRWGDYWRLTTRAAQQLFGDIFGAENVEVQAFGNVLVATAFLHGLALEELNPKELDYQDPDYPVIITVRAVKSIGTNVS